MDLRELRAISQKDVAIDEVELFGGEFCMSEAFEGISKSMKMRFGAPMREAKKEIKAARKLSKTDKKEALKHYDGAIKSLKDLRKEAEQIEDDHILELITESFVKMFLTDLIFGIVVAVPAVKVAKNSISAAAKTGGILKAIQTSIKVEKAFNGIIAVNVALMTIAGSSKAVSYATSVSSGKASEKQPENKSNPWRVGVSRTEMLKRIDKLISATQEGRDVVANSIRSEEK